MGKTKFSNLSVAIECGTAKAVRAFLESVRHH